LAAAVEDTSNQEPVGNTPQTSTTTTTTNVRSSPVPIPSRQRESLWKGDAVKLDVLQSLFQGRTFTSGGVINNRQNEILDSEGKIRLTRGSVTETKGIKTEVIREPVTQYNSSGAVNNGSNNTNSNGIKSEITGIPTSSTPTIKTEKLRSIGRAEFNEKFPIPVVKYTPWVPAISLCKLLGLKDPFKDRKIPRNAKGAVTPIDKIGNTTTELINVQTHIEFEQRLMKVVQNTGEDDSVEVNPTIIDEGVAIPSVKRGLLDESLLAALLGEDEEEE